MEAYTLFPCLRAQWPYQGQQRILEFFTAEKRRKRAHA